MSTYIFPGADGIRGANGINGTGTIPNGGPGGNGTAGDDILANIDGGDVTLVIAVADTYRAIGGHGGQGGDGGLPFGSARFGEAGDGGAGGSADINFFSVSYDGDKDLALSISTIGGPGGNPIRRGGRVSSRSSVAMSPGAEVS